MVEFKDGSIKAQISKPDMRQPIQYAFTYPERSYIDDMNFDFTKYSRIDFEEPDFDKFKCIKLAFDAVKLGGTYTVVLNIANDIAVNLFLEDKISFISIPELIDKALNKHIPIFNPTVDDIKETTIWTKKFINNNYKK